MKQTKKLFSIVLAIALVFAMAIPAFAAESGTITVTNPTAGQTYSIYKMFSFTPAVGGGLYTVAAPWTSFVEESEYVEIADGTIKWLGGNAEDAKANFAKDALAYAKKNNIEATDSDEADASQLVFSGLELGYYLVDSSLGALCALDTTNTNAEVTEKNSAATLDKEVQEDRDGKWYSNNDAAVGQDVNFRATITAGKGVENYVMHDKMEKGLEFKAVTGVTLNGTPVDASDYEVITDAEDLAHNDCTFEVDFTDAFEATLKEGDKIVVSYTGVLTADASIGIEDGTDNEAWLSYGDDNETTHDKTTTYTYKVIVDKVDGAGNALEGAGFTLYIWDATFDADETTEGIEGGWKVVSEIGAAEDRTTFEWVRLDEGKYRLEESTVPAGYNKAADIIFTVTSGDDAAGDSVDVTAEGEAAVEYKDNAIKTTVENNTGSLLPETGGMGTTMFYMIGAMMVAAAVVLLVSKKRMAFEA